MNSLKERMMQQLNSLQNSDAYSSLHDTSKFGNTLKAKSNENNDGHKLGANLNTSNPQSNGKKEIWDQFSFASRESTIQDRPYHDSLFFSENNIGEKLGLGVGNEFLLSHGFKSIGSDRLSSGKKNSQISPTKPSKFSESIAEQPEDLEIPSKQDQNDKRNRSKEVLKAAWKKQKDLKNKLYQSIPKDEDLKKQSIDSKKSKEDSNRSKSSKKNDKPRNSMGQNSDGKNSNSSKKKSSQTDSPNKEELSDKKIRIKVIDRGLGRTLDQVRNSLVDIKSSTSKNGVKLDNPVSSRLAIDSNKDRNTKGEEREQEYSDKALERRREVTKVVENGRSMNYNSMSIDYKLTEVSKKERSRGENSVDANENQFRDGPEQRMNFDSNQNIQEKKKEDLRREYSTSPAPPASFLPHEVIKTKSQISHSPDTSRQKVSKRNLTPGASTQSHQANNQTRNDTTNVSNSMVFQNSRRLTNLYKELDKMNRISTENFKKLSGKYDELLKEYVPWDETKQRDHQSETLKELYTISVKFREAKLSRN